MAAAGRRIGNDQASIAHAARRFLSAPARMDEVAGQMLAGQVRSVIGGATVEQIIGHRDRVTQEVKKRSRAELETLGIVVDALEIQDIEDTSGYVSNLAAPHAAAVARQARMAQQMVLARRQADIAALRLDADVRQSADAGAYKRRALAEADRDQAKFAAGAEAYRMITMARAETQAGRINAEPATPAGDQDQGRRVRLRPRGRAKSRSQSSRLPAVPSQVIDTGPHPPRRRTARPTDARRAGAVC